MKNDGIGLFLVFTASWFLEVNKFLGNRNWHFLARKTLKLAERARSKIALKQEASQHSAARTKQKTIMATKNNWKVFVIIPEVPDSRPGYNSS